MSQKRVYTTPENRKEEFRTYLSNSGVIEAISRVLVGLYQEPERPPEALEYVKRYIGGVSGTDIEAVKEENDLLKEENDELKKVIQKLTKENDQLQEELRELEYE